MAKAAFIARDGGFFPLDADGREMVAASRQNKPVMIHSHPARNPGHHRLLFALIRTMIEGGVWEGDEESLLDYIKYGVGHVRTSLGPNGAVHTVPKSINYESMDQAAFRRFFDRACWLICHRLLRSDDWEALRDELVEMIDGPQEVGRAA